MSLLDPILVARGTVDCHLHLGMANRHGLIAGATGTGKTVTLQRLAESLSKAGVPVFLADVKGDLAGISLPGGDSPRIQARVRELRLDDFAPAACPVTFWDLFGEAGHPVRATLSELGPVLLARLLQLNDTQAGVLQLAFRIADAHGLLLLDVKDLRALLQYLAENAAAFTAEFGNISTASVGAIQRNLLALESQGADRFFGEPALNLDDFLQTDPQGCGLINLLAADRLLQSPKVYATVLLWLLSELFERLPEVGDPPKPTLVFFFDEAHLLFTDAPPALVERIEQVVRLIRSKGVGVFFVTQNPRDIPDRVLGQLGNRVQHALRAFTPLDQKAVRAAAQTFRANPALDTETLLTQLGVGEALVSLLDENGQPTVVQRALVLPPCSRVGPIPPDTRRQLMVRSVVAGAYDTPIDRESAYERLGAAHGRHPGAELAPARRGLLESLLGCAATPSAPAVATLPQVAPRGRAARPPEALATAMAKSAVRTIGSTLGREIVRGVLGSIFGGRRRR
jgi:DNA helicase HerA-like ATPase